MERAVARRSARLVALLAAVLGLGAVTVPAVDAAAPGLVVDLTWFPPEDDRDLTARILKVTSSDWVRLDLGWRDFEPRPGELSDWSLRNYRRELERAREAGQRVILMVHTSPRWASGSTNAHAPPRDPRDFKRFLLKVGARYAPYVDAWEMWNEPNIERFWPAGPDPAEYVRLLRAGSNAIAEVDPSAQVVFGGLSTNDYGFVRRAYAAGAKRHFDVMATHPYACAKPPEAIERYSSGRMMKSSFPAYREVRRVMLANDDPSPIWFTEFGWTTASGSCGVDRETQADYLTRAFGFLEKDPYVEVATWYSLRNHFAREDADRPEAQYGLLHTSFAPKPAFWEFWRYARD